MWMPPSLVARIHSVSVVNERSELISTALLRTNMVDVAELVAIAIGMPDLKRLIIYMDSRVGVRAFARKTKRCRTRSCCCIACPI